MLITRLWCRRCLVALGCCWRGVEWRGVRIKSQWYRWARMSSDRISCKVSRRSAGGSVHHASSSYRYSMETHLDYSFNVGKL